MATSAFRETLTQLLKARFPIIYIEAWEERRVLDEIARVAADAQRLRTTRSVVTWSATEGLVPIGGSPDVSTSDLRTALTKAADPRQPTVFVFRDVHPFLGDAHRPADPEAVRRLRDIAQSFKTGPQPATLILLSPLLRIPPELEKDITIVDFPLPDEDEIGSLLQEMLDANLATGRIEVRLTSEERERLVKAGVGLTLHEAENAFARAMVDDAVLSADDIELVLDEKRQTIRKSGILDFVSSGGQLSDIGGLDTLKRWLLKRNGSWLDEAADYGVPAPRGVLITGVPGCGKSMTAKCISSAWQLPLLRMDIGRVFAGLVGSSEQNMRMAIRTAEAIAPCVLWIDELEKGFAGLGAAGDGGTTQRVFGTFLTWMQEKRAPVFVIATANDISNLPPEFLRKGRFDEIFFVDLPTTAERVIIWRLQLEARLAGKSTSDFHVTDRLLAELSDATEGYSGAEIEGCVQAALVDAFAERRSLIDEDLMRAARNMVPLSTMQAEQIRLLREWATLRAVSASRSGNRVPDAPRPPSKPGPAPTPDSAANGQRGGRIVDI